MGNHVVFKSCGGILGCKDTEVKPFSIFDQEPERIQNSNAVLTNINTFLEKNKQTNLLFWPQQRIVQLVMKDLSKT